VVKPYEWLGHEAIVVGNHTVIKLSGTITLGFAVVRQRSGKVHLSFSSTMTAALFSSATAIKEFP
jgi:hypothetical protein